MKNKGFTLIELLVVVIIIGILSSLGIAALQRAREKALIVTTEARIASLGRDLDRYYADNGRYPPDTGVYGLTGADLCQDSTENNSFTLHKFLTYDQYGDGELKDAGEIPKSVTLDGPDTASTTLLLVVDAWGMPFVYENHYEHFRQNKLLSTNADTNNTPPFAHRPDTYDIYSFGPDQELDDWMHDAKDTDIDQDPPLVDDKKELDPDTNEMPDDICNWY